MYLSVGWLLTGSYAWSG